MGCKFSRLMVDDNTILFAMPAQLKQVGGGEYGWRMQVIM